jgi:nitroimidazol reductase NimA-like FMN-containing flavoprotein (pyridoxamine 5'-phosphate oxidase superfamily)
MTHGLLEHGQAHTEPRASRAHFPPGYIETPADLLPWSHALERLEQARIYWIASVRSNGRPHLTPIWGVWLDNVLFFDGSPESRRSRNIAAHPAIAVHVERGNAGKDVVIVEGNASEYRPEPALAQRLAAAYGAKYAEDGYAPSADQWDNGGLTATRPRLVVAWTDMNTATRWHFDVEA